MALRCEICGKGRQTGFRVSHSNIKTKRSWLPNIRKLRAKINGTNKTIKICTRCLRAGKVERAV
ncbi:MAG: 50S ribosomal protein L28 [Firmicutes bacterium]|nr:50S ribosomal protein L28 [Bacillota bacterium]